MIIKRRIEAHAGADTGAFDLPVSVDFSAQGIPTQDGRRAISSSVNPPLIDAVGKTVGENGGGRGLGIGIVSIHQLMPKAVSILADRELLLRVMNNLITNSLQSIPADRQGRVHIGMQLLGDEVQITVADNGSGIPSDKLQTIFEPYFTTKSTGTGLGLAMVKQIVEGHNGRIWVQSTSSEGTVIELAFPVQ